MAFESLTEKLQNVFKKLRGKGRLTEEDVKIALKEVKMALLEHICFQKFLCSSLSLPIEILFVLHFPWMLPSCRLLPAHR